MKKDKISRIINNIDSVYITEAAKYNLSDEEKPEDSSFTAGRVPVRSHRLIWAAVAACIALIFIIGPTAIAIEAEQREYEKQEAEFDKEISETLDTNKEYVSGDLIWPLDSKWSAISSGFGWRILFGRRDHHDSIDIPADKGSPVYAAADGNIVFYGWMNGGGGNKCVIDHGSKLMTHYEHMSEFASELKEQFDKTGSAEVKKGDIIGYVGSTGKSTGNHLAFRILYDGTAYDPMDYVKADGSKPAKDITDLIAASENEPD